MTDKLPNAVRLEVDYPETLDRMTTFFRILWAIPIFIILSLLSGSGAGEHAGIGVGAGLGIATALMIVFRQKYPRWWFDFALELGRFSARVGAYVLLLTDSYPSTDEAQSVHVDLDYPDVENDLNRWLPLVKWLLAIPHYIVLSVLFLGVVIVTVIAWFAILFTGRYPQSLFDYVVGTMRWATRVWAYMGLMLTDEYPPFRLG